MSYSLTIRQKSAIFRTRPDLAALRKHFGAAYHIGGIGEYFNYSETVPEPGPAGEISYMVYGAGGELGRGFYMICDTADTYEITTRLPTTTHDLEDLFTFAGMLAQMLGVRELEADGRVVPATALTALFAELRQQNGEVLHSYAATQKEPVLSGVRMPLYLPEALCGRITRVPPQNAMVYLSSYLAERQATPYTWLAPVFFQGEQGENVGAYTLVEDTPCVIPKEPFVPAGPPEPFGGAPAARWQVTLARRGAAPVATVPYHELTAFLESYDLLKPFDDRHWFIRGLSLNRMNELANSPPAT